MSDLLDQYMNQYKYQRKLILTSFNDYIKINIMEEENGDVLKTILKI